jgi:alpha-glucosidase (family GH31 glycosyl hydrolase)
MSPTNMNGPLPAFQPQADPEAVIIADRVRFSVLTDRLFRLEFSRTGQFEDRPSQVFWYRSQPVPVFSKIITKTSIEIETAYLRLNYAITSRGFSSQTLSITLKESGITWRYGMRQDDNLKGTARTLDNTGGETRLENGLISTSGWAVVDDSNTLVFNQAGWLEPREANLSGGYSVGIHQQHQRSRSKDMYFFGYGNDISACLRDFTNVAGEMPMLPRYVLGNWWSRFWNYTQAELQALMQEFRAHQVPLSVCIIDMDWHITQTGNASPGWTGYTWNRELFPDAPAFIRWLHEQGLRTALNLHPASGIYPHEEQYKQMARWMGLDPASRKSIPFDVSDSQFIAGYFEILHHPYEQMGVDFWWIDWQQGRRSRLRGLDPLWGLNHLHYQDHGRAGSRRPVIFSRWGGLGNHRYPIGFSGDTLVRWKSLAYQPYFTATAANVGYGWWSHDIGGHMRGKENAELYTRWVQFGVFSPIFRLHSTKDEAADRRPWGKPERHFKTVREAMQLRHALIPYIYSMAWRAHRTGISLVTPMYYGNMDVAEALGAKDQYFFGSELLVAPILAPANPETGVAVRKVWFPPGIWYHLFDGEELAGGCWRKIEARLEDIPVYAKAGAIVPLAAKTGWGGIDNPEVLDLIIFPGADNSFDLYEDDGETTGYQRGEYALTRFTLEDGVFTIHRPQGDLRVLPQRRIYHIHLRGVGEATTASLPGVYAPGTRTYSLKPVMLTPRESLVMTFRKQVE